MRRKHYALVCVVCQAPIDIFVVTEGCKHQSHDGEEIGLCRRRVSSCISNKCEIRAQRKCTAIWRGPKKILDNSFGRCFLQELDTSL
ncbi:hypothetical protein ASE39_15315 [Acidovorax sp. Root267]|nr:hypothetical protein ASE39_15315 [Acidovorax sp. Root267]